MAAPPAQPGISFAPVRHSGAVLPAPSSTGSAAGNKGAASKASRQQGGEQLVLIGGGAFCFSFGSVFSECYSLDLGTVCAALSQPVTAAAVPQPVPQPRGVPVVQKAHATNGGTAVQGAADGQEETGDGDWVLQLSAHWAKPVKDALKSVGWLDTSRKAGVLDKLLQASGGVTAVSQQPTQAEAGGDEKAKQGNASPMVVLPLTPQAVAPLQALAAQQKPQEQGSSGSSSGAGLQGMPAAVSEAFLLRGAQLVRFSTRPNPKFPVPPQQVRGTQGGQGLPLSSVLCSRP